MPRWLPSLLDLALPLALGAGIYALGEAIDAGLMDAPFGSENRGTIWEALIGLAVGLCLVFAYANHRPIRFGLGIGALIVGVALTTGATSLYEDRSFFGVYKVSGYEEGTGHHTLSHGNTNHGAQVLGPNPPEPITYYHRTGPVGQLFDALPDETATAPVAAIGLGTGSLACHAEPGQQMTFYEIDPLIEQIARDPRFFTYLRDCPGEHDVVLGDARLKIAEAPDGEYGVIVGDAFSSDAIPIHLMTREAIELYFQKLRSDGVLAMHISNRHLALEHVLGDVAQDRGLSCYSQFDERTEGIPGKFASYWVVMAREPADLGSVPDDRRWQPCVTSEAGNVWTDDFSNLLSTFDWN